jgi:hypothetical protein
MIQWGEQACIDGKPAPFGVVQRYGDAAYQRQVRTHAHWYSIARRMTPAPKLALSLTAPHRWLTESVSPTFFDPLADRFQLAHAYRTAGRLALP